MSETSFWVRGDLTAEQRSVDGIFRSNSHGRINALAADMVGTPSALGDPEAVNSNRIGLRCDLATPWLEPVSV